ncbi:MAG TPA: pentapeptide repeat-containing protein [Ktedonobacterales bacterium]|jgi:uncharacterized protein YjbI with pentapeptide repeats|nr:pentapeptide repeat-containing protein [Ktedonobacterales bacterium]
MAETRKPKSGIKAPRLPKDLPLAESPADEPADGETCAGLEYQGIDLTGRVIARPHFDTVIFTKVIATGLQCDHLRAEDARFTGCNLANAVWPNLACHRAEFIGCRMTGFITLEAAFADTVFRDCKLDLAQFYSATMRGVRFEDCPLTGSDFRMTDLTGAAFIRCDLSNADFTGATLAGVDLRTCQLDGMRVGPQELRGATIDQAQALALVRAMGITVE